MKKTKDIQGIIGVIVIICLIVGYFITGTPKQIDEEYITYHCDGKVLTLRNTEIEISKDSKHYAKIQGDIIRFVVEPLKMYNSESEIIAYADDTYHFIAQDSHAVFVGEKFQFEVVGLVDFLGEKYEIYDEEGNQIGVVDFNSIDTEGEFYDMEGTLLADYTSRMGGLDYTVRITENCTLNHDAILLLMASYYSDKQADSK